MTHAFQFTPGGIVPLEDAIPGASGLDDIAGAVVPASAPLAMAPIAPHGAPRTMARTTLRPKDVIKLARQRLREVEREIRVRSKLEKERDELRRLLNAAGDRPVAPVRSLPRVAGR